MRTTVLRRSVILALTAAVLASCSSGSSGSGGDAPAIDANASTVKVSPASVPADGSVLATVTVTVRDMTGEPVERVRVGVSFSGPVSYYPNSVVETERARAAAVRAGSG